MLQKKSGSRILYLYRMSDQVTERQERIKSETWCGLLRILCRERTNLESKEKGIYQRTLLDAGQQIDVSCENGTGVLNVKENFGGRNDRNGT